VKKRNRVTIGIVAAILCCLIILFSKMYSSIQSAYDSIAPLDLSELPDGVYKGKAGEFIISVELEVTVLDHRITEINILSQVCGNNYKALDTISRIIDEQSATVDAVTGATMSSKSIMVATHEALNHN
jgi:uncharacterized protein with FMN-binding domain